VTDNTARIRAPELSIRIRLTFNLFWQTDSPGDFRAQKRWAGFENPRYNRTGIGGEAMRGEIGIL
jgi:hypothetical protein